jgi:hypothetical protein
MTLARAQVFSIAHQGAVADCQGAAITHQGAAANHQGATGVRQGAAAVMCSCIARGNCVVVVVWRCLCPPFIFKGTRVRRKILSLITIVV